MLFTTLGNIAEDASHLAAEGVKLTHHHKNEFLDNTGLGAFVPPALRATCDGINKVVHTGIKDVGSTSGDVLRSFE